MGVDLRAEDWHTLFAVVCNVVIHAVYLLFLHSVMLLDSINHNMGERVVQ